MSLHFIKLNHLHLRMHFAKFGLNRPNGYREEYKRMWKVYRGTDERTDGHTDRPNNKYNIHMLNGKAMEIWYMIKWVFAFC